MKVIAILRGTTGVVVAGAFAAVVAQAAEIDVVGSGGFAQAYKTIAPEYEHETGNTLVTGWGPSMGDTPDTVPNRLKRGEPIDVVIMVGYALGDLIKQGKVVADSRVDLAELGIDRHRGARGRAEA